MSRNNRGSKSATKTIHEQTVPDTNTDELPYENEETEEVKQDIILEETSEPVKQPEPLPVKEEVKKTKPSEVKVPMNDLLLFLDQYHQKILTLKHDEDVAKVQVSFYKKIMSILSKENFEEARMGINIILKCIHHNRADGLNEINMFRGAAHWEESPQEYAAFRRLLWIFLETADPNTRRTASARVDLTSLEKTLTPVQYSNLISFYG